MKFLMDIYYKTINGAIKNIKGGIKRGSTFVCDLN